MHAQDIGTGVLFSSDISQPHHSIVCVNGFPCIENEPANLSRPNAQRKLETRNAVSRRLRLFLHCYPRYAAEYPNQNFSPHDPVPEFINLTVVSIKELQWPIVRYDIAE